MLPSKLGCTKNQVIKARDEWSAIQEVKPGPNELLLDFLQLAKRFNDGEHLPNANQDDTIPAYHRRENNQIEITDKTVQIIRHVVSCFHLPLSRFGALLCVLAPLYIDKALRAEELSSESTYHVRMTRLHLIDRDLSIQEFLRYTAQEDEYGNPILFFHCDDDSKHLKEKRHALLFTARDDKGKPTFRLGTTAAAVTSDA